MVGKVNYVGESRLWWGGEIMVGRRYYCGESRLLWGGEHVEENIER